MKPFRTVFTALGICFALLLGASSSGWSASDEPVWLPTGLTGKTVFALAVHPTDGAILYAGTEQDGVYRTLDGGNHWTAVTTGMGATDVLSLAVDPQTPQTLYAGTATDGAFRSSDGGEHWTALPLSTPFLYEWAIDPQTPATLYLLAYHTLIKSVDAGEHWQACGQGVDSFSLTEVEMNPNDPQELYLSTMLGVVYRTRDGCASWNSARVAMSGISALAVHPRVTGWVYAATTKGEVFLSQDGGQTWGEMGVLPETDVILLLKVHPDVPSLLVAGTLSGGVYRSLDYGRHWTPCNNGLTSKTIRALEMNPVNPNQWFAGTDDGVFTITFPALTPQAYLPWIARAP